MKISELAKVPWLATGTLQDSAYALFLDPDVRLIRRSGTNPDVDSGSVPEDLWGGGGLYTGFPSAAEPVRVSSSSANDTSAGSGARTIVLNGLDASGNFLAETVTLNGTTPVVSVASFLRLNRAYVATSGNSNLNTNEGVITIGQNVTTANVFATIEAGVGESRVAAYTIPTGTTGLLTAFEASGIRSTASFTGSVAVRIRQPGQAPSLTEQIEISSSLTGRKTLRGGLYLPAGTDVVLRMVSATSNDLVISGTFEIALFRN